MLGFIKTVLMFSSCNLNRTPLDLHTVEKTTKVNTEDLKEPPEHEGEKENHYLINLVRQVIELQHDNSQQSARETMWVPGGNEVIPLG